MRVPTASSALMLTLALVGLWQEFSLDLRIDQRRRDDQRGRPANHGRTVVERDVDRPSVAFIHPLEEALAHPVEARHDASARGFLVRCFQPT
jgi:hypothetical protein